MALGGFTTGLIGRVSFGGFDSVYIKGGKKSCQAIRPTYMIIAAEACWD